MEVELDDSYEDFESEVKSKKKNNKLKKNQEKSLKENKLAQKKPNII